MSNMPWIDAYEPRDWTVYQLSIRNPDGPVLADVMDEFEVCGAESGWAAELYKKAESSSSKPPNFFFWDLEQMSADHNAFGINKLGRLTAEWNGHPAGSLVMVTYEGMSEDFSDLGASQRTYFVENT
jgi:hypothetical protein